jgi:4-amino-4-deoxy-L-arabinose transferase-like glycosyltransferase
MTKRCANKAAMSERATELVDADRSRRVQRRFMWTLAGVTLAALGIRVMYVLTSRKDIVPVGDSYFYHAGANLLARGHGFIEPYFYLSGHTVQAAEHPPLYLVYLSVPSFLGMTSTLTHLLWSCVLGAATVFVVGLLGRAVLSARVGVIAAILAALYPNLWFPDGSLQAETAAMFTTALTVLLAYRYLRRPSMARLAAVGAAAGVAALARSELILLAVLVVVPLALSTRTVSLRRRLCCLAVGLLATMVVIGPWIGFNLVRFRHPVYLSAQYPALLASANCDATYNGSLIGYFSLPCAATYARQAHVAGDQSQMAIGFQRSATNYIRRHLSRVPVVVAARVGRILEVFRPSENLRLREYLDGAERPVALGALVGYYVLALLSIVGGLVLRRRGIRLFPLLAPVAVVLITVVVTYGNTRFRAPAEVVLAVLGAVAIDTVVSRLAMTRARRARPDTEGGVSAPGATAG